jgi:hypothetical protein
VTGLRTGDKFKTGDEFTETFKQLPVPDFNSSLAARHLSLVCYLLLTRLRRAARRRKAKWRRWRARSLKKMSNM